MKKTLLSLLCILCLVTASVSALAEAPQDTAGSLPAAAPQQSGEPAQDSGVAAAPDASSARKGMPARHGRPARDDRKGPDISGLVQRGVISQSTADAIAAYLKNRRSEKPAEAPDTGSAGQAPAQAAETASQQKNTPSAEAAPPQEDAPSADAGSEQQVPAQSTQAPARAKPRGAKPQSKKGGSRTEPPVRLNETLLKEMLDAGVITQSDYDALLNAIRQ